MPPLEDDVTDILNIMFDTNSSTDLTTERLGSTLVTIVVGVGISAKQYHVHQTLICNASEMCRATFTGSFKEAAEKKMILVEDNPKVFDILLHWLYTRQEPGGSGGAVPLPNNMKRIELLQLADKLLMPELTTFMSDLILDYHHTLRFPTSSFVQKIYASDMSTPIDNLRQYIVCLWTYLIKSKYYPSTEDQALYETIPQFGLDVLKRLSTRLSTSEEIDHPSTWQRFSKVDVGLTGRAVGEASNSAVTERKKKIPFSRKAKTFAWSNLRELSPLYPDTDSDFRIISSPLPITRSKGH